MIDRNGTNRRVMGLGGVNCWLGFLRRQLYLARCFRSLRWRCGASTAPPSTPASATATTGGIAGACGCWLCRRCIFLGRLHRFRPKLCRRAFDSMFRLMTQRNVIVKCRLQRGGCRFRGAGFGGFLATLQAVAHPFAHAWLVTYSAAWGQCVSGFPIHVADIENG